MYSNSIETLHQSASLNALAIQKSLDASPDAKQELEGLIDILGKAQITEGNTETSDAWYQGEEALTDLILEKIYTLQSVDEELAENLNLDTIIEHTENESGSFINKSVKKFFGTDPRTMGLYENFKKSFSLDVLFGKGSMLTGASSKERRGKEAVAFKSKAKQQGEKLEEIIQLLKLF